MVKIEFDKQLKFNKGANYHLYDDQGDLLLLQYLEDSRVDGFPIFKIISNYNSEIKDYSYNKNSIIEASIFNPLGDHHSYKDYTEENEQLLMNYIYSNYGVNYSKMKEKGYAKQVIRQLKIDKLVDKNV